MEISAYRLAKETFLPQTRISEIIKGNRIITTYSAIRFATYFRTSAKFCLGLQADCDLEEERNQKEKVFNNIKLRAEYAVEYTFQHNIEFTTS
jgi:antitoxin HigA-1